MFLMIFYINYELTELTKYYNISKTTTLLHIKIYTDSKNKKYNVIILKLYTYFIINQGIMDFNFKVHSSCTTMNQFLTVVKIIIGSNYYYSS